MPNNHGQGIHPSPEKGPKITLTRILCKGRRGRIGKFVIADAVDVLLRERKRILCRTRG